MKHHTHDASHTREHHKGKSVTHRSMVAFARPAAPAARLQPPLRQGTGH